MTRTPGRTLALLVPLWLALAPASGYPQDTHAGAEVVDVTFVGAETFPDDLLRTGVETRRSRCRSIVLTPACELGLAREPYRLDPAALRQDGFRLRLFYYQRGYRAASVSTELEEEGPGRVQVRFRIVEGEPVRVVSLTVNGLEGVLPRSLSLPLAVGDPFNLLDYEAARDTLLGRLRNSGYARAEVLANSFVADSAPLSAEVEYEVIPGERVRYGEIEVVGNERVSRTVVRRMLSFRPGAIYRENDLVQSQRNLFGLDIFRHAEIRPKQSAPGDTLIPILVQVNEGDVHRVRLGAGITTAECASAEGRWASRNFLGGARGLEVRARLSNILAGPLNDFPCYDTGDELYRQVNGSLAVDFTQPWFFAPRNTLGAGLLVERRSLPDVFVREAVGGYVSVGRRLRPRTFLTLAYRPELTRLDAEDLLFCANFVVCEERDIALLKETHWLSPITASFTRERANSLFAPTSGGNVRVDAEFAAPLLGSDFSYTRLLGEATLYQALGGGIVLALRGRPGWSWAGGSEAELGIHPQKRFFAGGASSVRGYAQHRLGPKVLTVDAAGVLAREPTEEGEGAGCSAEQINIGTCSPSAVDERFFQVRPVGGAALLEGNLELRFPLLGERLRGAAFLDVGQVWSEVSDLDPAELAWTPGAGVRYFSPIGPIRVDIGYRGGAGEALRVITTRVERDDDGTLRNDTGTLIRLARPYVWGAPDEDGSSVSRLFERLQLHFSIGQAF